MNKIIEEYEPIDTNNIPSKVDKLEKRDDVPPEPSKIIMTQESPIIQYSGDNNVSGNNDKSESSSIFWWAVGGIALLAIMTKSKVKPSQIINPT